MTRGGFGVGVQLPGGLQPVEPRHPDVHQHHVGPQLGRAARRPPGRRRPRRRPRGRPGRRASGRAPSAPAGRRRRPARGSGGRHHAAHGIHPCSTNVDPSRPLLEPAAAQLGALGEPDQAEPGARRAAGAEAERVAEQDVDAVVRRAADCDPAPRPVRACRRWSCPPGRSGRRSGPTASGTARVGGERSSNSTCIPPRGPRRPAPGGRRTSAAGARAARRSRVAEHAEHAAQVGERLVGVVADDRGAGAHLVGGEVVAEGQRAGVHARSARSGGRARRASRGRSGRARCRGPGRPGAPARPRPARPGGAASRSARGGSRCTCPSRGSPAVKIALTVSVEPHRVAVRRART